MSVFRTGAVTRLYKERASNSTHVEAKRSGSRGLRCFQLGNVDGRAGNSYLGGLFRVELTSHPRNKAVFLHSWSELWVPACLLCRNELKSICFVKGTSQGVSRYSTVVQCLSTGGPRSTDVTRIALSVKCYFP